MSPVSHKHNPKYLLYVKAGLIYIVANKKNESLLKDFCGSPLLEMCVLEERLCVRVCVCVLSRFSHVRLFMTLWTLAH